MDDHDLALKPMLTWGVPAFQKTSIYVNWGTTSCNHMAVHILTLKSGRKHTITDEMVDHFLGLFGQILDVTLYRTLKLGLVTNYCYQLSATYSFGQTARLWVKCDIAEEANDPGSNLCKSRCFLSMLNFFQWPIYRWFTY